MSRVNQTPRLARADPDLERLLREQAAQINRLAEGRIAACYSAATTAPSGGAWAQGDFVRNSAPAEAGTAGGKYVIFGWICVVGGTPGTWVDCRFLTGN